MCRCAEPTHPYTHEPAKGYRGNDTITAPCSASGRNRTRRSRKPQSTPCRLRRKTLTQTLRKRPATPVLPLSKICWRILTMAKPRSHERHHLGLRNFVQYRRVRELWLVQKWTIPAYPQTSRRIKSHWKLRNFGFWKGHKNT